MSTLNTTNLKNPSAGSNNIVLNTDGSATVPTLSSTTITGTTIQGTIKSGTAVASTSGTSIDFTGIPSWVKKITVMFNGVSTNGGSPFQVQIGDSGGIETTGYSSSASYGPSAGMYTSSTTGFVIHAPGQCNASTITYAAYVITQLTGFSFTGSGTTAGGGVCVAAAGGKTLSDTLTQVRITTVNGTDTFDAGTINILYEG